MNSKQARKVRRDLGYKPQHASIHDRKHYRKLSSGQIVCIGPRKAYKLAKKARQRDLKGS